MSLRNSQFKHLHWLLYPIFILACARQTTPTGGPKDSIPPRLISAFPEHEQINFKDKTIILIFSEQILLNNPREELIITPGLEKDVDIKATKNRVELSFQEELRENTTYTLNFREAVQDVTEKNPAAMLKLAFSTGNYIDSLSIQGNVYDMLTAKEAKDATIGLYETDTFDIFKHRPTYFTKSDDKGKFTIENLKPGNYFVYAILDKNKNLIVDSKTESYAFLSQPISLAKNENDIQLPLIRLDSRPLKLTNARPYNTYFNIRTTKSLTTYKLHSLEKDTIISSFGEDQSNIKIYNTFQNKDSTAVRFRALDSINNQLDTTLYIKFFPRETKPEAFNVEPEDLKALGAKGILRGQIKFSKPLASINFDSIYYQIDSINTIYLTRDDLHWDSLQNILHFQKTFDKNLLPKQNSPNNTRLQKTASSTSATTNRYQLYFGHASFVSIESDSSKRITEKIQPSTLAETGVISVDIRSTSPHYFVQLLTKDFQIVETQFNKKQISFEDLKPGDYQIRLVIDRDNDGKWDLGNFYTKEEPEQIIFYRNEKLIPLINLKANWELGPLLITE